MVESKYPGRVVTMRKFVQEEDVVPWLVQDLLPDVGWTLLIGRKGVGKTTFALQLATALQEGVPLFEREVKQTNVLFIQCDSPVMEWREIVRRVSKDSIAWTMVNTPTYCLDTPTYVAAIADLIGKVQPGFIIWDSLYKLTRKPVNERITDIMELMSLLACDKPWLLIHHPPHHETRAAGHHSLGATCSNEWHLLKNKLAIDKGRLVKDKEILLSRDEDGFWKMKEGEEETGELSILDGLMI